MTRETRECASRIDLRVVVAMATVATACSGHVPSDRSGSSSDAGGASGSNAVDGSADAGSPSPSPSAACTTGACLDVTPVTGVVGPDGGLESVGDATSPSGPLPVTGLHALCTGSWASGGAGEWSSALRNGNAAVAVDAAGNIVVATVFEGQFGTVASAPTHDTDILVMKLDPQCHVVWTRQYGAYDAILGANVIATDTQGDVIVGGTFQTPEGSILTAVDFGAGPLVSSHPGAFITKLDPSGKTLWVRTSIPPDADGFGDNLVDDLAVDPSGNAIFVFNGVPDFGAGAILDAGASVDLVKLDPDGHVVFERSTDDVGLAAWSLETVSVAPDGTLWAAGANITTGAVGAVHLTAAAAVLSTVALPAPANPGLYFGGAARVGSGGGVALSGATGPGQTSEDWDRWFAGVASTDENRWQSTTIHQAGTPWDPAQLVRVDADGYAWVSGPLLGTLDLGAPVGVLSSTPSGSMVVLIYGPDGKVHSGTAIDGVTEPFIGDMALGADRSVVLAGWDMDTTGAGLFFVSKLGF
jgi:hypothetical protein